MNSLFCIAPYWHNGTWVFDDPTKGLTQEPFVAGVPDMIDNLVQDIPHARRGFALFFSTRRFPGHQRCIEWVREEENGNWYRDTSTQLEGWLCPALFKYFDEAPKRIYVQATRWEQQGDRNHEV